MFSYIPGGSLGFLNHQQHLFELAGGVFYPPRNFRFRIGDPMIPMQSSEPKLSSGQPFQLLPTPIEFVTGLVESPKIPRKCLKPIKSTRQGTGPNAIWIHYLCAQAITNGNPVVCGPRVEKDHLQLAIFGIFSMGYSPQELR